MHRHAKAILLSLMIAMISGAARADLQILMYRLSDVKVSVQINGSLGPIEPVASYALWLKNPYDRQPAEYARNVNILSSYDSMFNGQYAINFAEISGSTFDYRGDDPYVYFGSYPNEFLPGSSFIGSFTMTIPPELFATFAQPGAMGDVYWGGAWCFGCADYESDPGVKIGRWQVVAEPHSLSLFLVALVTTGMATVLWRRFRSA